MTTETTGGLRERARQAAERLAEELRERAERDRVDYNQRACRAGASTLQRRLGVDTDPQQWTPTGEPSGHHRSATVELEGLKFLAVERYEYDYGHSDSLYLLARCENPLYPPHEMQADIASLADLHVVLEALASGQQAQHFHCPTCTWHAQQERSSAEAITAPAPSPAEELYALLCRVVRDQLDAEGLA